MAKFLPTIALSILTFHVFFIATTSARRLKWKDLHNPTFTTNPDQLKMKMIMEFFKFSPVLFEMVGSFINMIEKPHDWKQVYCPGVSQIKPGIPFPYFVPLSAARNLADWAKIVTYGIKYRREWKTKFCAEEQPGSGTPNGMRPIEKPSGSFGGAPSASLGGLPSAGFGGSPSGSFAGPPSGSFGGPPSGSFGGPPSGSFGGPPSGSFGAPTSGGSPLGGFFSNWGK